MERSSAFSTYFSNSKLLQLFFLSPMAKSAPCDTNFVCNRSLRSSAVHPRECSQFLFYTVNSSGRTLARKSLNFDVIKGFHMLIIVFAYFMSSNLFSKARLVKQKSHKSTFKHSVAYLCHCVVGGFAFCECNECVTPISSLAPSAWEAAFRNCSKGFSKRKRSCNAVSFRRRCCSL